MKNDDYGFYGKGLDGYVHYRQGMQEAARNAPNASGGRRPVSAEQKTTEPAPKSDESGQISKWILQHLGRPYKYNIYKNIEGKADIPPFQCINSDVQK